MSDAVATFGAAAALYAQARPGYPDDLFAWLAAQCAHRDAAWDCATGNGQAAAGLALYFRTVFATDRSVEQIAHAAPAKNIVYSVQPAEETAFAAASMDLITVAQALHWFDFARFWPEVRRVAKPSAVFAAFGYAWSAVGPVVDRELMEPFNKIIAPFWAPNNRLLWDGYRDADIAFPFARMSTPAFHIVFDWTIGRIIAYLETWSAYRLSLADPKAGPAVTAVLERARRVIPADEVFAIRTPLTLVAARVG